MKTINLILSGFLLILLFSCSSDDDNPAIDIVGTWTLTEGHIDPGTINMDMGGMQIPMEVSGEFLEIDPQNRLTFKEDGTFNSVTGRLVLELTMNFMGTTQTETFEENDIFGDGTWVLNGRELKISNSTGTTIPYKIVNISASEMELTGNVRDMVMEGGNDPMLESMDITIRMKLKRI